MRSFFETIFWSIFGRFGLRLGPLLASKMGPKTNPRAPVKSGPPPLRRQLASRPFQEPLRFQRASQDHPKSPKRPPRRPKTTPNHPQDDQKWPQTPPKTTKDQTRREKIRQGQRETRPRQDMRRQEERRGERRREETRTEEKRRRRQTRRRICIEYLYRSSVLNISIA